MTPAATVDFALMLLADARLPSGGHTQSAGLEPALAAGLTVEQIPAFLRTRLRTQTMVDAATAVVAAHALQAGLSLAPVQAAWAARTPSQHVRAAAALVGRGYTRLLTRLWPDSPAATAVLALGEPAYRPLALAALAFPLGLNGERLARLACYDDVQTCCAAALKLLPLDPVAPLSWALGCADDIALVAADVAGLTDPDDLPATAAPALEAWQHAHATSSRRLFTA